MPNSPAIDADGPVTLSILSDGKAIEDTVAVVSVEIHKAVNAIPTATLSLADGGAAEADFPLSNQAVFEPGRDLEIRAGYAGRDDVIFRGVVIRHGIRIPQSGESLLVVECRDKALAMTLGRRSAVYESLSDGEIIERLVANYPLRSRVARTDLKHDKVVQYDCSDWDFLLARAEVSGALVFVDDGQIRVSAPDFSESPELGVGFGDDLIEFNADLDAATQYSGIRAAAWDADRQAVLEERAAAVPVVHQGNVTPRQLAQVLDVDLRLQTSASLDAAALQQWASGCRQLSELAAMRGDVTFQGSAKAIIGRPLEVSGVGERFTGRAYVTAVEHTLRDGNWQTRAEFGLPPQRRQRSEAPSAPIASGLVPGVHGLQVGMVTGLAADPADQSRVLIELPVQAAQGGGVWARLAMRAGSQRGGADARPEVGDEIVVGFLNGDPSQPIVLGGLYDGDREPPKSSAGGSPGTALASAGGLTVALDDDKQSITLATANGSRLVLSDDENSISLRDRHGNRLELRADGILLGSERDIDISARGRVNIDGVDGNPVSGLFGALRRWFSKRSR